jgi:hypothetical protein
VCSLLKCVDMVLLDDNIAVALPRSRSTPGLVESVGKVPLELMPVKRHSVAPPNSVPTVKRLDVGDSQPGSPAVVARTVPVGVCSPSADRTAVASHLPHGIVYSATMSSLTSYVADSVTTPLSPSGVAADDVMMYHVTTSPQRLADANVSALGSSSGGSSRIMSMPATPSRDVPVPSDFRSSTGAPTLVYPPPSLQPNHPSYPTTSTLVYPSTPIIGYSPQPTGDRGSAFVSICRPSSPLPMQWQPVGYAYRSPSPYPPGAVCSAGSRWSRHSQPSTSVFLWRRYSRSTAAGSRWCRRWRRRRKQRKWRLP